MYYLQKYKNYNANFPFVFGMESAVSSRKRKKNKPATFYKFEGKPSSLRVCLDSIASNHIGSLGFCDISSAKVKTKWKDDWREGQCSIIKEVTIDEFCREEETSGRTNYVFRLAEWPDGACETVIEIFQEGRREHGFIVDLPCVKKWGVESPWFFRLATYRLLHRITDSHRHAMGLEPIPEEQKKRRLWTDERTRRLKIEAKQRRNENTDQRATEQWKEYMFGAKKRNLEFSLTRAEFNDLVRKCCEYCGREGPAGVNGLDRIANNRGYTIDNVCPCCWKCNHGKYTFTREEWIDTCRLVADRYPRPHTPPLCFEEREPENLEPPSSPTMTDEAMERLIRSGRS